MLKFPSIATITDSACTSFRRFPITLLCSFGAALLMNYYISLSRDDQNVLTEIPKLSFVLTLGISLFLGIYTFIEKRNLQNTVKYALLSLGGIFLAGYYAYLTNEFNLETSYLSSLIFINFHLFVSVSPFLFAKGYTNAFWQYNRILFLRILTALVFSCTLYIGLAGALAATEYLLGIKIDHDIYGHLWFWIIGIFNTWYFLSGIPASYTDLEHDKGYPGNLKVFSQFILIPLVSIYIVILYMYLAKIIAQWSLPVGWVSSLVIVASLTGIFALLLVWPKREEAEFAWVRIYAKYLYILIFPLVILMAVAITRRVSDYGITVQRYFVLLYTIWLFMTALVYTFRPQTNIRFIPTTLFIFILFATWGPWSALTVSRNDQLGRLMTILENNNMLKDGKIQKNADIPFKDKSELTSITYYIQRTHSLKYLKPYIKNADLIEDKNGRWRYSGELIPEIYGFSAVYSYGNQNGTTATQHLSYNFYKPNFIDTTEYDYFIREAKRHNSTAASAERQPVQIVTNSKGLSITRDNDVVMEINCDEIIEQAFRKYGEQYNSWSHKDSSNFMIERENDQVKVKIFFSALSGQKKSDNEFKHTHYDFDALIKLK